MGLLEVGIFEDLKEEHRKDSGLTREDIESLTVDENLTDLQRTQLFLSTSAHQLQQSCAFERLPNIFIDYGVAAYDALFPTLASSIEHFTPHIQVLAGKSFAMVMETPNAPKDLATWLLPITLRMINSIQIHEILQAWVELLCLLVPKLSLKVVKEDLLQLALARGKVEESVSSRVICSRLLGAISPMLEPQEIEQFFLNKAMALCQDTDAEVRISMCNQINAISQAVGIETTKKTVLPELYELLKDEEVAVHCAALACLIDMLDFLPSDVKRLKILPILRLVCNQDDAKMLLPLSRIFGELMLKMAPDLSEEDVQLFVDSYKSLCRHSSEEVRQLCAQNFPAVVKSIGPRKYAMTLHLTYQQLVQDPSPRTRCSISATFHEVTKILGKERTATYLKEAFLFLMTDNSREVQQKLIATLQLIIESVLPVRSAGAITLARFIRNNHRAMQRYELCQRVVREFGHGRSYTARLVFIDFCEAFMSISSSHMFKEHFLDAAISILQDDVVGVRMRACALLPLLKGVVKLPEDAASLERINFLATQRLNDNDNQVAAAAKAISDTFKHISVRCLGVEPGNENYAVQMEIEATDKQREEDEWNMLSKEEQEEQRKLDEMIQKMKLDGNKKLTLTSGASPAGVAAERASTIAPSKMPALARFKSTVASFNLGSSNQLGVSSGVTKQGGSNVSTMATGMMLSRSPPILRAQGAPISAGLAKAISLQQGVVTPLAPSSVIRTIPTSISMPAPAQVKPPAAPSAEPINDPPPPVSSGSNVAPSKGTIRPNLRTARKSS